MDYKWIGAVLIIAGCGGFGFSLAAGHRNQERSLQRILRILDFMASELHFHATPLPQLCAGAAKLYDKPEARVFSRLAESLESHESPEVAACLESVLTEVQLPPETRGILCQVGTTLGRFDLEGQLKGLEEGRELCRHQLKLLGENRDTRLRNYQTLSLCTGAALAILLI